ncbi:MAG: diguanylate cyclase [Zoogloeaceae bacterium]|jgi:diguanylate cyclase (GGDEF)-like protein|nr:diguanylate cyclase [Zoogloeaceae bacterium]
MNKDDLPSARFPSSLHILLVEDNPGDVRLFQEVIRETPGNLTIDYVTSLEDAFLLLAEKNFDVILLDLYMPGSGGLETVSRMREHTSEIPIVVLTGLDDEQTVLNAIQEGAQDYLIKGAIDGRLLLRSLRYAIECNRMQATIRALSMEDELTGLYNRHGFMNLATHHVRLTRRRHVALRLLFLDIDGMQEINRVRGRAFGDQVLLAAARLCSDTFRTSDIVARVGGDEFAIIATDTEGHHAESVIGRLHEAVTRYNQRNLEGHSLSFSYGTVFFQSSTDRSLEHLLSEAQTVANTHKLRLGGIQREETGVAA